MSLKLKWRKTKYGNSVIARSGVIEMEVSYAMIKGPNGESWVARCSSLGITNTYFNDQHDAQECLEAEVEARLRLALRPFGGE